MRFFRLLFAGLVAVLAVGAVLFTAFVVIFTGLVAYLVQFFRRSVGPTRAGPAPGRPPRRQSGEVIDVVATNVPADPAER